MLIIYSDSCLAKIPHFYTSKLENGFIEANAKSVLKNTKKNADFVFASTNTWGRFC